MRGNYRKLTCSALASLAAALMLSAAPTAAVAQTQCASDENGPSQTLSPAIGKEVQKLYELMQNEQYQEALAGFNALISSRSGSMSEYEKATVYELRAGVKVNLDDYRGALADFTAALNSGGFTQSRNNQLRYYIAQLNFQIEQFQTAISGLNQWINSAKACGQPVDSNAYYLLAAAYASIEPPNYRSALNPIEQALANMGAEPKKGYFDLANLVYSELNMTEKRTPLLEQMVNFWPGEKSYWTQLSAAYNVGGRDREAFSVLEVAYRAGLLKTENELLSLIQYYSFFDNPYRGAVMLEREMNAGNIKRTQKNLILLSQLWSQSREHKKSIPILEEAAKNADTGELYYRLGMVLLADEQYAASQRALERALNRGGMDRDDTGDAWLLLGTARFSQAGPSSISIWSSARKAFVNAQRYEKSRRRASDWITYIDAVVNTYWQGQRVDYGLKMEDCKDDIARYERDERIRELQNRPADPAVIAQQDARKAECKALEEEGAPSPKKAAAEEEAAAADETADADAPANE